MKVKIGHMACPDCGKNVAVKRNEHETLSYFCDECDGNGYSKKTEDRYALWMAKITLLRPPAAPPPPEKKPAGPDAPPKKPSPATIV